MFASQLCHVRYMHVSNSNMSTDMSADILELLTCHGTVVMQTLMPVANCVCYRAGTYVQVHHQAGYAYDQLCLLFSGKEEESKKPAPARNQAQGSSLKLPVPYH